MKPYLNAFDGGRVSIARNNGASVININGPNLKGGKQKTEMTAEKITRYIRDLSILICYIQKGG
jgi:hypothetical protein